MIRPRPALAAAALLLAAACAPPFPSAQTQVGVGEDFQLARGQSAAVRGAGVVVRFSGVAEDSRCPVEVQCIRAGEARARFELWLRGHEQEEVILATEPARPRYASYYGYDLRLVRLDPPPHRGVQRPAYVATLRLVRH